MPAAMTRIPRCCWAPRATWPRSATSPAPPSSSSSPPKRGLGGARAMLAEGLFERFPCDEIYGMHNSPYHEPGIVGVKKGPAMAGANFFDIRIDGKGCHAAMPESGIDTIVVATALVQQLQTIGPQRPRRVAAGAVGHADPFRRGLQRHPRQRHDHRHRALFRPQDRRHGLPPDGGDLQGHGAGLRGRDRDGHAQRLRPAGERPRAVGRDDRRGAGTRRREGGDQDRHRHGVRGFRRHAAGRPRRLLHHRPRRHGAAAQPRLRARRFDPAGRPAVRTSP
jgi:hypothetical protein